jgi:hypothetical protein
VLHTANPLTGRHGDMFGELVAGLGEVLVSAEALLFVRILYFSASQARCKGVPWGHVWRAGGRAGRSAVSDAAAAASCLLAGCYALFSP